MSRRTAGGSGWQWNRYGRNPRTAESGNGGSGVGVVETRPKRDFGSGGSAGGVAETRPKRNFDSLVEGSLAVIQSRNIFQPRGFR